MKTVVTFLIILFTSAAAMAQNPKQHDKVDVIKMGIIMVDSLTDTNDTKTLSIDTETSVTRLYRNRNSRVTRELTFITKKNNTKLA